jgi:hypothetical protein
LTTNTNNSFNTAIGSGSLQSNTGYENTAVGYQALTANTTGFYNTAVGNKSLDENTTGYSNTGIGYLAIDNVTTGYNNVGLGYLAGDSLTTGNTNTFIGSNSDTTVNSITNSTAIGNGASVTASNQIRIGNSSVTSIGGQVGWTTLSDARDKTNFQLLDAGINFINELNPIRFDWNQRGGGLEGRKDVGFTAQELLEVQEKTNIQIPNLVDDSNPDKYSIMVTQLIPILVKSVQELTAKVSSLENELNELKNKP